MPHDHQKCGVDISGNSPSPLFWRPLGKKRAAESDDLDRLKVLVTAFASINRATHLAPGELSDKAG